MIFNIFERLQDTDRNRDIYHCLLVSKRWHSLALPLIWQDFEFHIINPRHVRLLDRLLEQPDTRARFEFVRSLFLKIHLRGERVVSLDRCQEIAQTVAQFTELLKLTTGLQSLRLVLETFVESNSDHSVWEQLREVNSGIMELTRVAGTKEYAHLFLDIAQPPWSLEDGVSEISRQYVEHLGPQTTRLHLFENAVQTAQWFNIMPRIRTLQFENTGNGSEGALLPFWEAIKNLSLEDLTLTRVPFPPRTRRFTSWQCLRTINLNQFNDVEGTCATILKSFPNLYALRLHNPINLTTYSTTTPIPEIVCTGLRIVVFTRCKPQRNLTAAIAKASPNIRVFMPPNNADDTDIITLIDHCPFLDTLSIDYCHQLTSLSFHYIPRAKHLRSFRFYVDHFMYFDMECIIALATCCPDLHSRGCRVQSMGEKNEESQRIIVREKLRGSSRFKRWVMKFIVWQHEGPALHIHTIDIDRIREDLSQSLQI